MSKYVRQPGSKTLKNGDMELNYHCCRRRLKEGVSVKKILQDIREEITVDSGRKMLIEKKDIHNIKRDFNINGYIKRHEVDAMSVKLWTHEMKIIAKIVLFFFPKSRDNQGMTMD
ncbi:c2H2-type domain-containing protein [Trichonephila clavata]|uniref:C2H2-type domain-containing protein n=1 Tax=Trichonephila clavata TaxID=2740835 RepID=A0A8X6KCM2_TRICU|nr:c2H2-type domain-containing protein [Trichonephila clavata]